MSTKALLVIGPAAGAKGTLYPYFRSKEAGCGAATVAKCSFEGVFSGGRIVKEGGVRDGNLVSGRRWHNNSTFLREYRLMLADAETW